MEIAVFFYRATSVIIERENEYFLEKKTNVWELTTQPLRHCKAAATTIEYTHLIV